MGSVNLLHRLTIKCLVLVFVCLVCHILLSDSAPVRKRRVRSTTTKSASAENEPVAVGLLRNDSSNIVHHLQSDDKARPKVAEDGKPGEIHDPAPVMVVAREAQVVGQLMAMPGPLQPNRSLKTGQLKSPDGDNNRHAAEEEQGVAVGVGAMNRKHSTTTQRRQAYHQGPDNSLDVGAADRRAPQDRKNISNSDALPVNLALQQPPPQAREPPVDQFRDKPTHLGPVKPKQNVVESGPAEPRAAVENHDEPQLHEPPALPVHGENEALKFNVPVRKTEEAEKPVKLADLNPPDHLEGVRMEQDGHLNRDYKKEIFLGHHEEFEWSDEEKVSGRLKVIFRRADRNGDNFLEMGEIQEWIMMNVRVHLEDAVKDNAKVFRHLDADKDGFVSWDEFYAHFLLAKGYIRSAIDPKLNITLELDDNEQLLKYKYRWTAADEIARDHKLEIDEMMNFRHPEQSKRMISELVKELMDNVDRDGDEIITEREFIALPHDLDGQEPLPLEEDWQAERKKEFHNVIDLNGDGKVVKNELTIYFDPYNMNHAKLEAENLIRMADANEDGKLSMEEVLENTDLFVGSKMVDAKRKLHDEF